MYGGFDTTRSTRSVMPREQIGSSKGHAVGHAVPAGVAPCDRQSRVRHVCRDDPSLVELTCERDRETAGASSSIDDDRRWAPTPEHGENLLDDEFGFGSGNQGVRRHFELESPELTHAENKRHWFAALTPRDQTVIGACECGRWVVVATHDECGRVPAQGVTCEQFGVESGFCVEYAGAAQPDPGGRDVLVHGHRTGPTTQPRRT